MLPREVREFWQAHKLAGSLDIKEFSYTPATKSQRNQFRLQTELKHVTLIFHSEEFDAAPTAAPAPTGKPSLLAYANQLQSEARRLVYVMHALPQRPPIVVNDVTGEFFFDQNGISFQPRQPNHRRGNAAGEREDGWIFAGCAGLGAV